MCILSLVTVTDFGTPIPSQLVFDVETSTVCTGIATIDDDIYEENETLSVSLSSTSDGVSIIIGSATVEIINNDGKCLQQSQEIFMGIVLYSDCRCGSELGRAAVLTHRRQQYQCVCCAPATNREGFQHWHNSTPIAR